MSPGNRPLQFPTILHHALLAELPRALTGDERVTGVMVIGSLARGTAREDWDIDMVVGQSDRPR